MATLATETWTGSNGAAWPAQWTSPTAGTATIQSNTGQLLPAATSYASNAIWLTGQTSTVDFDLTCDVGFAGSNVEQYVGVGMSVAAGLSAFDMAPVDGYNVQFLPSAANFHVVRTVASSGSNLSGDIAYTYTSGTRVNVQLTRAGGVISVFVWNVGSGKPGTANWSGTDGSPIASAMKVWLGNSNGSPTTQRSATFDNLTITDNVATSAYPFGLTTPTPRFITRSQ
jgi:hypothetical protein